MLDAARALLGDGDGLAEEKAGRLSDVGLGRSYLSRVLIYALDATYQMPVHQLSWAKRLLAPLHRLATTETLMDLSARGAQKLHLRRAPRGP